MGVPSGRVLKASTRPAIAVIGDDDYRSTGPTGWAAARRFQYWARAGMIHGTGAEAEASERELLNTIVADVRLLRSAS